MSDKFQEFPQMLYRGKPQAEPVGAEEHIIVNSAEEKAAALKAGYRASPAPPKGK